MGLGSKNQMDVDGRDPWQLVHWVFSPTPHYKSHLCRSKTGKHSSWESFQSSNTVYLSPSSPLLRLLFQSIILPTFINLYWSGFPASPGRGADSTQHNPHACQARKEWIQGCTQLCGSPCCHPVQQLEFRGGWIPIALHSGIWAVHYLTGGM